MAIGPNYSIVANDWIALEAIINDLSSRIVESLVADSHARVHGLTSTADHTVVGLTTGHVLQATGATTFGFAAVPSLSGLYLTLDQTTPQTFTNFAGGTGLMKVTAGLLGLDTNTYLTSISGLNHSALAQLDYASAGHTGFQATLTATQPIVKTGVDVALNYITTNLKTTLDGGINKLDTIQGISTAASPQFTGLTLSGLTNTGVLYNNSGVVASSANLTFDGANFSAWTTQISASWIHKNSNDAVLNLSGGTAHTDGAYFSLTGLNYASGSPGYGSGSFVIRTATNANDDYASKFEISAYNGSSWSRKFALYGSNGYARFTNFVRIGSNTAPTVACDVTGGVSLTGKLGIGIAAPAFACHLVGGEMVLSDGAVTNSVGNGNISITGASCSLNVYKRGVTNLASTTAGDRWAFYADANGFHFYTGTTGDTNLISPTGNWTLYKDLNVSQNFKVATNKFTVDYLTGNTIVAGTLGITSLTTATGGIYVNSDSNKLALGNVSGGDLQLYHNGTNSYIHNVTGDVFISNAASTKSVKIGVTDGATAPTNYTQFDSTGHQTMVGTARPWRDELADAISLQQTGSGVSRNSSESTVDFTTGAQIASDYMYCNLQLNHDKDLTASIYPHIHFFQAENNIPNFLLQYRWQTNGGTKVTSWTSIKCNTLAFTYSSGTLNQIAYTAAISVPAGTAISDIVQFRICRDTDNDSTLFTGADPYTTTVGVLAFDIHFMINSLGSTDEYTK